MFMTLGLTITEKVVTRYVYLVSQWHLISPLVARKNIFSLKWRYYGPKRDILDYRGTLIFCLLPFYILSMNKCL